MPEWDDIDRQQSILTPAMRKNLFDMSHVSVDYRAILLRRIRRRAVSGLLDLRVLMESELPDEEFAQIAHYNANVGSGERGASSKTFERVEGAPETPDLPVLPEFLFSARVISGWFDNQDGVDRENVPTTMIPEQPGASELFSRARASFARDVELGVGHALQRFGYLSDNITATLDLGDAVRRAAAEEDLSDLTDAQLKTLHTAEYIPPEEYAEEVLRRRDEEEAGEDA